MAKKLDCLQCPDFPCFIVCPDCGGQLDENDDCPSWYEDGYANPQPNQCPAYFGERRKRGAAWCDYNCAVCPSIECKVVKLIEPIAITIPGNATVYIDPRELSLSLLRIQKDSIEREEAYQESVMESRKNLPKHKQPYDASYWQNRRLWISGGQNKQALEDIIAELEEDIKNNPMTGKDIK